MNELAQREQTPSHDTSDGRPFYGRLSIAHLFLIMTFTALRVWLQHPPGFNYDRAAVVFTVIFSPIYGTAFAALVISLSNRPARPFATEPGHWLLLFIGAASGLVLYIFRVTLSLQAVQQEHLPISEVVVLGLGLVVIPFLLFLTPVLLISAAYDVQNPPRWKLVFRLLAGTLCLPIASCLLAVAIVVVFYAAVRDIYEREYRDMWHWLGIFAFVAVFAHAVLHFIAFQMALASV